MGPAPRSSARACRICLSEDFLLKSIFDNFATGATQISEVMRRCASIQIRKNDGLPEQICSVCVRELHRSLSFRDLCEKTDAGLREDLAEIIDDDEDDIVEVCSPSKQREDPMLVIIDNVPEARNIKKEVDESAASISSDDVCEISAQRISARPELRRVKQERVEPEEYIDYNTFLQDIDIEEHPPIKTEMTDFGESVSGRPYIVSITDVDGNEMCASDNGDNESQSTQGSQEEECEDMPEECRPFKCEVCDKSFLYRSNLKNHARTHSGAMPYPCDLCEEKFAWKTQLIRHKKYHYKCKMCPKAFSNTAILAIHAKTHGVPAVKAYPTKPIVSKQEPDTTDYVEKIEQPPVQIPKPNKSLECIPCNKTFGSMAAIVSHRRHIHPVEYYRERGLTPPVKVSTIRPVNAIRSPPPQLQPKSRSLPANAELYVQSTTSYPADEDSELAPMFVLNSIFDPDQQSELADENSSDYEEGPDKSRRFRCKVCGKTFLYKSNLVNHSRTHTGETPHKCDICNEGFTWHTQLKRHRKSHFSDKMFDCEECDEMFDTRSELMDHAMCHVEEQTKFYRCQDCPATYTDSKSLANHRRVHMNDDSPFRCSDCPRRFKSNTALMIHKKSHEQNKPHKCEHCGKAFPSRDSLVSHMKLHPKLNNYDCGICKKRFTDRVTLIAHTRVHTGARPYQCERCDESYTFKSQLIKHMKSHVVMKSHRCAPCNKLFGSMAALVSHRRHIHPEAYYKERGMEVPIKVAFPPQQPQPVYNIQQPRVQPMMVKDEPIDEDDYVEEEMMEGEEDGMSEDQMYQCEMCEKMCRNSEMLAAHRKMHTEVKIHRCETCDKVFMNEAKLLLHNRTHVTEMPYACELCGECFPAKTHLISHKRMHTDQIKTYSGPRPIQMTSGLPDPMDIGSDSFIEEVQRFREKFDTFLTDEGQSVPE